MNLLYIADVRFPTEKAHGIQIMAMCQAFSRLATVQLLLPARYNPLSESAFAYYQQPETFTIQKIPILDLTRYQHWLGDWVFPLEKWSFSWEVRRWLRSHVADLTYHRDFRTFLRAIELDVPAAWEVHDLPRQLTTVEIEACNRSKGLICITQGLKQQLMDQGIQAKRLFVAPDGVDLARFQVRESVEVLRQRLYLPMDKILLIYAGHLYPWKGVDTLLEAMQHVSSMVELIVLGGGPRLDELKKKSLELNIACRFIGAVAHGLVPDYLAAADMVAIPNSGKEQISRSFTSPLKVFEAMAVGKAIIASDLPSLREVLQEDWAVFAPPDDPGGWGKQISTLAQNTRLRTNLGQAAARRVQTFDWNARATHILHFLNTQV